MSSKINNLIISKPSRKRITDSDSEKITNSDSDNSDNESIPDEPIDEKNIADDEDDIDGEDLIETNEGINEDTNEGGNEEVNDEEVNDTELKDEDNKLLDNCYYQYDNLIEEYAVLTPATRVLDEDRITPSHLTKFEIVRVLGIRAHQISVGAKTFVKNIENKTPLEIAIFELKMKTTPLKIKRPLPNNTYEIWKIKELDIDLSENEEKNLINVIHS